MANEIRQSIELSATKNGASVTMSSNKRITMTGDDMVQGTQVIGTTSELLVLGDITGAPSQIAIKNLDSTNFVEIGGDSGLTVFKVKLLPTEIMLIRPTSGTIYAKADTAAVRIAFCATEE